MYSRSFIVDIPYYFCPTWILLCAPWGAGGHASPAVGAPGPSLEGLTIVVGFRGIRFSLVAEWIHFTRLGIVLPTLKIKV